MLLSLVLSQVVQSGASIANAATEPLGASTAVPAIIPDSSYDPSFAGVVPRVGPSPWDGEAILAGTDGLAFTDPSGLTTKVRAVSSVAFFVDEVWLVYPRVQYLFNNKDVKPPCSAVTNPEANPCTDDAASPTDFLFGKPIDLGVVPQGTEMIFGVKTGVGIDNTCVDRLNSDGSVDAEHHCYSGRQNASFVPLAPDPLNTCGTDQACLQRAWPTRTPDGRAIYYTGPAIRNVESDSAHGRFQFLDVPTENGVVQLGFMGFEDVGQPTAADKSLCISVKVGEGKSAGEADKECSWHPDFQDAGILVYPVLSSTCGPTTTPNVVEIVGQPGYSDVVLNDTSTGNVIGSFGPGALLRFTAIAAPAPPVVTLVGGVYEVQIAGSAEMVVTDPTLPVGHSEREISGGMCWSPEWPPVQRIQADVDCTGFFGEWDFSLTGLAEGQAPPSIRVTWSNGESATAQLGSEGVVGGVAHYRTSLFPDLTVIGAVADLVGAWSGDSGAFALNCGKTEEATVSCADAALDPAAWTLKLSGISETLRPATIAARFLDESGTVQTETIQFPTFASVDGVGVASYRSISFLTGALIGATAQVPASFAGDFELASGPCTEAPPPPPPPGTADPGCIPIYNPHGEHIPTAGENPRSGQNPDGFYLLLAGGDGLSVRVKDTDSSFVTPSWPSGTTIKLTQAPGGKANWKNGTGAIDYKVHLNGDAEIQAVDTNGQVVAREICYVPPFPKAPPTESPPPTAPPPSRTPAPTLANATCGGSLTGEPFTPKPSTTIAASAQHLHVGSLHISCSDMFPNGYAEKSDLDGHRVAEWWIVRNQVKSTKCIAFFFRYTDGHVDSGMYGGGMTVTNSHDLTSGCVPSTPTTNGGGSAGTDLGASPTPSPTLPPGLAWGREGNAIDEGTQQGPGKGDRGGEPTPTPSASPTPSPSASPTPAPGKGLEKKAETPGGTRGQGNGPR